jgi:hypothetical protein
MTSSAEVFSAAGGAAVASGAGVVVEFVRDIDGTSGAPLQ